MNLERTNSYSVQSIWTILDDYLMDKDIVEYKKQDEENPKEFYQMNLKKSEMAMDRMHTLMDQGYNEREAWEIVSTEMIYT